MASLPLQQGFWATTSNGSENALRIGFVYRLFMTAPFCDSLPTALPDLSAKTLCDEKHEQLYQNPFTEDYKMRRVQNNQLIILVAFLMGLSVVMAVGEHDLVQAQSVVGVWECPGVPTPWCVANGKTVLMKDGTFTKTVKCGEMSTWDKGTYTVGEGYIHYKIQDHEPKVYKGKTMNWFKEETSYFQFAGPDQIVCGKPTDQVRVRCYRAR
jgi:hypothetical protein